MQFASTDQFLASGRAGTVLEDVQRPATPKPKAVHVRIEPPELIEPKPRAIDKNTPMGRLMSVIAENARDKAATFGRHARAAAAVQSAQRSVHDQPTPENVERFVKATRDLADAPAQEIVFEPVKRAYQARVVQRTKSVLVAVLFSRLNELERKRDSLLEAFKAIAGSDDSEGYQQLQKGRALAALNAQIKSTAGPLSRLQCVNCTYQDLTAGLQIFKSELANI